jgi:hypothetical protein
MEKRKRVPVFILSWMTTYPWLQNSISGMTCTVCTQFDKTGTFITGCNMMVLFLNWMLPCFSQRIPNRRDPTRFSGNEPMNQRNGNQQFLPNNVIGCYTCQQGLY